MILQEESETKLTLGYMSENL